MLDEARFKLTRGRDLAAPAEPDAPVFLERRPQRYFEPPARLALSPGTETRLETTSSRAKSDPPEHREPIALFDCTKIFLPRIRVFAAGRLQCASLTVYDGA